MVKKKLKQYRYIIQMRFIGNNNFPIRFWDIHEPVKTLSEARTYKSMVDNTVRTARIVDTIKDSVVEQWK